MVKCADCEKEEAVLELQFPDGAPVKYCQKCYDQLVLEYDCMRFIKPKTIKK